MRFIADVDTEKGYRVVYDPFPGWETVPEWLWVGINPPQKLRAPE